jgi:hypothetical protein
LTLKRPSLEDTTNTLLGTAICAALAYWLVYTLVTPVVAWDAHAYNVSRAFVLEEFGLFGERTWNNEGQVAFPWTFDVNHYPILKAGLPAALPSLLYLLGILVVVYRQFSLRYGAPFAAMAVLDSSRFRVGMWLRSG